MLSGKGLCDELITRPEESYRLCCVVVCDLETSRMGAPYIYDISYLRVNDLCFSPNIVLMKLSGMKENGRDTGFVWGWDLKEGEGLENLGLYGRIILKHVSKK